LRVRRLHGLEKTGRRLEALALDALLLGRLRSHEDTLARIESVTAAQVRKAFGRMLGNGCALAITGRVPRGTADRARSLLAQHGLVCGAA